MARIWTLNTPFTLQVLHPSVRSFGGTARSPHFIQVVHTTGRWPLIGQGYHKEIQRQEWATAGDTACSVKGVLVINVTLSPSTPSPTPTSRKKQQRPINIRFGSYLLLASEKFDLYQGHIIKNNFYPWILFSPVVSGWTLRRGGQPSEKVCPDCIS